MDCAHFVRAGLVLSLPLGVAARGNREPIQFCIMVDQRPFAAARRPSQDLDKPPAYGRGCATHVLLAPMHFCRASQTSNISQTLVPTLSSLSCMHPVMHTVECTIEARISALSDLPYLLLSTHCWSPVHSASYMDVFSRAVWIWSALSPCRRPDFQQPLASPRALCFSYSCLTSSLHVTHSSTRHAHCREFMACKQELLGFAKLLQSL